MPRAWNESIAGLAYGGDYNPEQWPEPTRIEDIELMVQAGVNLVSVGIFSWAELEPEEGVYSWQWLDDVLDRLHAAGIGVALATATASPPPWLTTKHPEILPQREDGTVLHHGGRQAYAVSSPLYREYAVRMTRAMAERYADHPALRLWHIDNELGCHVPHDFSPNAARAFRRWLQDRYGTVEALNAAWGTAFWAQRYSTFEEVLPPLAAPTYVNPTQQLDFARYSSDEQMAYHGAMVEVLREVTPDVPVTSNLMASSHTKWLDYFSWARTGLIDVVANDHYLIAREPEAHVELAFSADLARGIAGGAPWILMEHATSAVNWQPHNRSRRQPERIRNSLQHIARGADACLHFQWRQSAAGAEKYHSAMVPHAGPDSAVFRGTVEFGELLARLAEVRGSRVRSRVALVFDYPSWWGSELDSHPTSSLSYPAEARRWYAAFWRAGVSVDIVPVTADLEGYSLIVAPTLYLVDDQDRVAERFGAAAQAGASVAITFFSGIVDQDERIRLGGYPGAFRELLGVRTEEFWSLQEGEGLTLSGGGRADLWSEDTTLTGAEAVQTYTSGELAGQPAITRRALGEGAAWYVATRPDELTLDALVADLLHEAGVRSEVPGLPAGVEAMRRHAEDGTAYLFVLNHTDEVVHLPAAGTDLVSGTEWSSGQDLAAGAVAVLREP